ncbi:MAG: DUF2059 domain-containing protein [Hyphomicrobiales bacterium]|nr:DUF2059 domain-containing protein [Hyphomicrobiales bacterium]MBV8440186.1 DUF2059 domain-containing protein [Hyphomicrobiales bacterium]
MSAFEPARKSASLSVARTVKGFILAASVVASAAGWAADSTAPAAPAAPAAPPSSASIAAADAILGDIGVKQTIALVVPGMMTELERNVTNTRPEIRDSLRETLRSIQPEFDKSAQQVFIQAATLLASQMSEKEIEDVAAFFGSSSGKKYLATEPAFFQQFSAIADPWRQQLSVDILTRARQEMKKKGIEF